MAAGLVALLDDISALVRSTAATLDDIPAAAGKASAKSLGVVVDDTAVTPRYVEGLSAKRELPIIGKIALGSLRNKLLIILPVILLLSWLAPWGLTPLLMAGGLYLSFEGAEKVLEALGWLPHHENEQSSRDEKTVVSQAVRTDLILSGEIMVIALNEVSHEPIISRAVILIFVAVVVTIGVYGVVGIIVKMDDVGLALSGRRTSGVRAIGRGLVRGMPVLMRILSVVGVAAMMWVGGHILLAGVGELGWSFPGDVVHRLAESIRGAAGAIGGVLAWFTETLVSAAVGLVIGSAVVAIVVAVRRLLPRKVGG